MPLLILAPNAELMLMVDWGKPDVVPTTVTCIREFLTRHTTN